jgi:hypothetical protein
MAYTLQVHNLRSLQQWGIISQYIDFENKSVIDLGCGWGDLLRFADCNGARVCIGVDKKKHNTKTWFINADLEEWINSDSERAARTVYDVALCFSVLPYLIDWSAIFQWMSKHATVSFIECQYADDGPGKSWLKDDSHMRVLLRPFWNDIKPIGHTIVKDRNAKRTIWMCE